MMAPYLALMSACALIACVLAAGFAYCRAEAHHPRDLPGTHGDDEDFTVIAKSTPFTSWNFTSYHTFITVLRNGSDDRDRRAS